MAAVIVQLSDTHLSPSRPYFQMNFEHVLEALEAIAPDHVVVTGDLALNGPDDPADIAFARRQLERLLCAWDAVPGNHDVGLHPFAGGMHQPVTEARLAAYRDLMGPDRFATQVGGWTLIGANSQLMGSGLAAEAEQADWLAGGLARAGARPTALFLHYPAFLDDPATDPESHACLRPSARAPLLGALDAAPGLRFVASGHLHVDRAQARGGVLWRWAPSTAFVTGDGAHGGVGRVGFLVWRLGEDGEAAAERVEPRWLINHDIANWGGSEPHGYYDIVRRPWPALT
jgi:3',5'-cyclic AMP phosphodiesterase CpdA